MSASKSTSNPFRSPTNYLVYLIAGERLYGKIAGQTFDFKAFSGGGRGSVGDARSENSAASFDYRVKSTGHGLGERGGPIPPGQYLVHPSEQNSTLGRACKLASVTAHLTHPTRGYAFPGGFYIHGRGQYGSDGCIVPELPSNRKAVQDAIDGVDGLIPLWVVLTDKPPSPADVLKRALNPFLA